MRLLVLALCMAMIAFVGFSLSEKRADERRLAAIAREIAHRDVAIRCQSRLGELVDADWDYGSVDFGPDGRPGRTARLDREICVSLLSLMGGREVPVEPAALAVEALAHEAYHLAGVQDEAAAHCYGLQAIRFVAARLGVSVAAGDEYVRAARARYSTLPEAYRSLECREGGALDLRPTTGIFP